MKYPQLAVILVTALVLAACGRDTSNIKPPQELSKFTPTLNVQRLWTASIGRGADKAGMRMGPAFEDGVIYAASVDGYLKAIDASNGRTLWQKAPAWRPGADISYAGGPSVDGGVLAIGTLNGNVYTFDAKSGEPLWQARVDSSVLSPPVFTEDLVLVRSDNGKITAFKRADGERAWLYDQAVIPSLGLRGNSNLIATRGVVFFGTDNGKLTAIRLDNGEPLWDQPLSQGEGRTEIERLSDADGQLVLGGDTLYAAAYHGNLRAVDARNGQPLWEHAFSSYAGLALSGTTLVGVDEESEVWAWTTSSGANLWKQDGLQWRWLGTPAIQEGHVVVGDIQGYVHWLDLSDGSFSARIRMSRSPIHAKPLVLEDGRVVVEDVAGNISCWQVGTP